MTTTTYRAEEFENPFCAMLLALHVAEVTVADYEIIESCPSAVIAQLAAAYVAHAEAGVDLSLGHKLFQQFLLDCRRATQLLADDDDYLLNGEWEDGEGHQPDHWPCSACGYEWNPWEAESCSSCQLHHAWEAQELLPNNNGTKGSLTVPWTQLSSSSSTSAGNALLCATDLLVVFDVIKGRKRRRASKRRYAVIHPLLQCLLLYDVRPSLEELQLLHQRGDGMTIMGGSISSFRQYDGKHLFRVERVNTFSVDTRSTDDDGVGGCNGCTKSAMVRLYFQRPSADPQPLELTFETHEIRERFMELTTMLKQGHGVPPTLWCPPLSLGSDSVVLGITDDRQPSTLRPTRTTSLIVTKCPYEVARVFAVTIALDAHGKLPNRDELSALLNMQPRDEHPLGLSGEAPIPTPDHAADRAHVVAVGLQRLHSSTTHTYDGIASAIHDVLGGAYYIVVNTANAKNTFAGIDTIQGDPVGAEGLLLLFIKKTALHKVSSFRWWSGSPPQADIATTSGEAMGNKRVVFISFAYLESTIAFCMIDTSLEHPDDVDTAHKNAALLAMVKAFDAPRHDVTLIMGHMGYVTAVTGGTVPRTDDELESEMGDGSVLSGFHQPHEATDAATAMWFGCPGYTRMLYRCRHPNSRRVVAVGHQYDASSCTSTSSNAACALRIHCLRPYGHALLASRRPRVASLFISQIVVRSKELQGHGGLRVCITSPVLGAGIEYVESLMFGAVIGQYHTRSALPPLSLVGTALEWASAHDVVIEVMGAGDDRPKVAVAAISLRDVLSTSLHTGAAVECSSPLQRATAAIGTVYCSISWVV